MKRAIVLLIALAAWASPIHAASSQTKTLPEAIQITTPNNEPNPRPLSTNVRQHETDKPPINDLSSTRSELSRPTKMGGEAYSGRYYSKEEVQDLIIQYSSEYGIDPSLPLRVADCESGFNQFSKNKSSTASGVFQFIASTWRHTEAGRAGTSVLDADANVHMAIKSIASGGINNWAASRSCWNK